MIVHASLLFCNHLPANYCIQYYVQVQMYGGRYKNHNDIYIVFVCHDKKHDQKNKAPITYANNQVLPTCASVQWFRTAPLHQCIQTAVLVIMKGGLRTMKAFVWRGRPSCAIMSFSPGSIPNLLVFIFCRKLHISWNDLRIIIHTE